MGEAGRDRGAAGEGPAGKKRKLRRGRGRAESRRGGEAPRCPSYRSPGPGGGRGEEGAAPLSEGGGETRPRREGGAARGPRAARRPSPALHTKGPRDPASCSGRRAGPGLRAPLQSLPPGRGSAPRLPRASSGLDQAAAPARPPGGRHAKAMASRRSAVSAPRSHRGRGGGRPAAAAAGAAG